jgi:hypothetical protein
MANIKFHTDRLQTIFLYSNIHYFSQKLFMAKTKSNGEPEKNALCGIIMPISQTQGYPPNHWNNVLSIITEAVQAAGCDANLVSKSDEVNIIQHTIVNNIYTNDIVVCDVSSRNPNVAFELGMRLTFDKPTVIIKDDSTVYPFDISIVEYIEYRTDLRYQDILNFKGELTKKIVDTLNQKKKNDNYSPFLRHFGQFTVPKLQDKEVSNELILSTLYSLQTDISKLKSSSRGNASLATYDVPLREYYAINKVSTLNGPKNLSKYLVDLIHLSPTKEDGVEGIENFLVSVKDDFSPLMLDEIRKSSYELLLTRFPEKKS